VYVVVVVGLTLVVPEVPETGPVQEVALVVARVRVDEPPEVIEVGLAVRVTVGAGVPPPPAAE
jgi:hypothetical protein